jgi:DNA polymerase III subunit delta
MDAFAFLEKSAKSKRLPIYAVTGDEDFLRRQVRDAILELVLGDSERDLALSIFAGDKLEFPTVRGELDTLPFIGPARVVVVENADPFVMNCREYLERYAANPSKVGVLVLEAKTFPETTRLAKALPDGAKIACKSPKADRLLPWCVTWAKLRFGKRLELPAAELLLELVGPQMGLLAQEIEKLAVAAGEMASISLESVNELIGRSRAANVFHILNAIGDGQPARALKLLTEVFEEGDEPLAVMGAFTGQFRKLATVGRLTTEGLSLGAALDAAGVPKWPEARISAEKQVKHLGRRRLDKLLDWLVEINLGLKGGNQLPGRLQVERFVVRLARPRA